MKMERDFYADLGVPRSATEREIKKAYRTQAKQCHPDVDRSEQAMAKWRKINDAYNILNNPNQKKRYDMYGESGLLGAAEEAAEKMGRRPKGAPPGGGFGGPGGAQQVDLSDIFDSFFGGGGGGAGFGGGMGGQQRRRGPVKGDDLRFDLKVDFKKACFGGKENIRIKHLENCDTCGGTGAKPGTSKKTCSTCGGQGMVMQVTRTPLGSFQSQSPCPQCRGEGTIIEEYCGTCVGKGVYQKQKEVVLTVPAGVETGQKLRVRDEGDASANGGPPGDLYIFINVEEDAEFKRVGTEIYTSFEIPYLDAILGDEVQIKTIDGEVTMQIPAGSQPESVLKMRGKGAPRLGDLKSRGDHFVTLKVQIPKKLSRKERELVTQLKSLQ